MLIGGLWHGASWMFIIWGGLHGTALCINKLWQKTKIEFNNRINIALTFIFINFTWIIFRANNFSQVKKILYSLINFNNFVIPKIYGLTFRFMDNNYEYISFLLPLALILVFWCKNSNQIIADIKLQNKNISVLISIIFALIFIISIIKTIAIPYSEFIYFNF